VMASRPDIMKGIGLVAWFQAAPKETHVVIPMFPPVCKYNYNSPRDYDGLNMCESLI
jgi:hypothetical protein